MISDISKKLRELQTTYISKSFKYGKDEQADEVIDILSDYPWSAEEVISNGSELSLDGKTTGAYQKTDIPFCYVVERKSAANAGIANILNLLNAMGQGADKVLNIFNVEGGDVKDGIAGAFDTVNKKINEWTGVDIASKIRELAEKHASGFMNLMSENNLCGKALFEPYKYLYITKATKKKFVFPLLSSSASFSSVKNSWGEGNKLPGIMQVFVDGVYDIIDTATLGINLVHNAMNVLDGSGSDIGKVREMAKSFEYPTEGDGVTVGFTLYNTTKLDAWKDNYKFLYLFVLRNMPLRIDTNSFLPPMLYDVIVPGTKRLPVCSVDSIDITPKGMTRVLKCDNFLGNGEISVNVPEAWEVSITFRSLIANSANLVLAGIWNGLNVTTSSINNLR